MPFDFPTPKERSRANNINLAIYVPSTRKLDKPISSAQFKTRINQVVRFLNNTFGGTTRVRGIGSYNLGSKTISEKVAIVETFTQKVSYDGADIKVKRFLLSKKRQWGQDSIGYEFEGSMFFI